MPALLRYNRGVNDLFHDVAPRPMRVILLGASGTIGQATLAALLARGHEVVCFMRPPQRPVSGPSAPELAGASVRYGVISDAESVTRWGFQSQSFDAVVSCMASRSGLPQDAWAVDHEAHRHVLDAALRAGVQHFVLLSAICVQKPRLAFQHAKLAFEQALIESGMAYSIVRPTAYFKSLSGQIQRVREGKPFWVFGDGRQTACKPIADEDLADYLAQCLTDPARRNQILPIGGPGPAITPLQQAEELFRLLDRPAHIRHMPLGLFQAMVGVLSWLARWVPSLRDKAEFARIGLYYASESMLVLDPSTGRYNEAATPSHGQRSLFDFYQRVITQHTQVDLGDHAVF
jgi:divinyl chlorophyllide a 8-vinyl-reductase